MPTIRRIATIAVASGVAVASLAGPAVAGKAAKQPTTKNPSAAAAGYLVHQLGSGDFANLLTTKYSGTTYADYGDTADAALSLAASKTYKLRDRNIANTLAKHVNDYALYAGADPGDYYPGSVAKLLLVAEALHMNPASFGGVDLIGAIVGTEGGGGAAPGQYQNPADTTYSSSVTNQALSVLALANTVDSDGPSTHAVDFLVGQMCDDGGFQNDIRSGAPCDTSSEDVDATSYAIQALIAAGDPGDAKTALAWLATKEKKNGGWTETTGKADANSTSLAVEALIAGHRDDTAGMKWLKGAQIGCAAKPGQRGAVSFNGSTYNKGTDIRATAQAGVALAGVSLTQVDKNGSTNVEPVLGCKK